MTILIFLHDRQVFLKEKKKREKNVTAAIERSSVECVSFQFVYVGLLCIARSTRDGINYVTESGYERAPRNSTGMPGSKRAKFFSLSAFISFTIARAGKSLSANLWELHVTCFRATVFRYGELSTETRLFILNAAYCSPSSPLLFAAKGQTYLRCCKFRRNLFYASCL